MNRNTAKNALLLLLILVVALPATIRAGSIFSRYGIGLLRYRDSAKATAMGGVSLAIADSVSIYFLNPATMASVTITHFQGEFLYDRAGINLSNTSATFQEANMSGLGLLIPVKRGYAFTLGLQPYSRVEYEFSGQDSTAATTYEQRLVGSGGLDNGYAAFAATFGSFRFGIAADFYFGLIKKTWRVDYPSSQYRFTEDQLLIDLKGFGFHGGIHTRRGPWEFGVAAAAPANLNADLSVDSRFDVPSEEVERTIRLPAWYGVAVSYHPSRRLQFAGQWRSQAWGSVESNELLDANGVDSHTLGAGLEFIPSFDPLDGLFKRMHYRVGATYAQLPYAGRNGDKISEWTVTAGFGLPFNRGFSRIDFAFELGKRGDRTDLAVDENVFRFSASVSGSERWFQRRRR